MRWLDALLGRNPAGPAGAARFDWYVGQADRYRLWVAQGDAGSPWHEVQGVSGGRIGTAEGRVPRASVRAWVATYPGGTVVDQEPAAPRPLPAGVRFLPDVPRVSHLLTSRDFVRGRDWIAVGFSASGPWPDDRGRHCTTLRNNGLDGVRVMRFAAYRAEGVVFRLDTITGGFFSESDFREWYGLPDGWLEPRREVADRTAFSEPGTLWAYELETRAGDRFWTGATTPRGPTG